MSQPTYTIVLTSNDISMLQVAIDDSCYAYEMNIQEGIDPDECEEAVKHLEELSHRLAALLPPERKDDATQPTES